MTLIVNGPGRLARWSGRVVLGGLLLLPAAALALGGAAHEHTAKEAVSAFRLSEQPFIGPPNTPAEPLVRRDTRTPFFPALDDTSITTNAGREPGTDDLAATDNGTIIWWYSTSPDQFESIAWNDSYGCPAVDPTVTIRHFWGADIGGALGMTAGPARDPDMPIHPTTLPPAEGEICPGAENADIYPNAWMKGRIHWQYALRLWQMTPDDAALLYPEDTKEAAYQKVQGAAYANLGMAVHMLLDVSQPAHVKEDMHNESDSYELWYTNRADEDDAEQPNNLSIFYSWFVAGKGDNLGTQWLQDHPAVHYARPPGYIPRPGDADDLLYPPDNADVCYKVLHTQFYGETGRYDLPDLIDSTDGVITLGNDPDLVNECAAGAADGVYRENLPQLFYLFYVLNQIGDYYPSDEYDGDTTEPTHWLRNWGGFPVLNAEGENIHSKDMLADNWYPENNDDGDLTLIITGLTREQFAASGPYSGFGHYGAYQAAFMGTHVLLDLFRNTIDGVPPVTDFAYARQDGKDYVQGGWNSSEVTVTVVGAEDLGRPGIRPSGMAGILARWNGEDRSGGGSWTLGDGKHVVHGLSYDKSGAIDTTDVHVWVDRTPPVIEFLDLKPVYLTSETFVPRWTATDALSGVAAEWADLDGIPVTKELPVDLSLRAGFHTLTVGARDVAGNEAFKEHHFEVLIDAQAWPKPPEVNAKSNGSLMCFVEFPAPYDVMLIDVARTYLVVNGLPLPTLGITAPLDGDKDGLADRMLRFDAAAFNAAAVAPGTEDAKVLGQLRGGELAPRFVAACDVPIFAPGR